MIINEGYEEFQLLWELCMRYKRLFTASEERYILKQIKNGNIETHNEMIMAYLWLAISLAVSQREITQISLMELAEEAIDELRVSIREYDFEGSSMLCYLSRRIKERLRRIIQARKIDISGFPVVFCHIVDERIALFREYYGRMPTAVEFIDTLDLDNNMWLYYRMYEILDVLEQRGVK